MIDQNTLLQFTTQAAWIVPLTSGIIAAVRKAIGLPENYIPLISLFCGISLGLLAIDLSLVGGIVGAMCGLASTGLYEFVKKPETAKQAEEAAYERGDFLAAPETTTTAEPECKPDPDLRAPV